MGSVKKALKKSLGFTTKALTAGAWDGQGGGWAHDAIKGKGGGGPEPFAQTLDATQLAMQRSHAQQTAAANKALNVIPKAYAGAKKSVQLGRASAMQGAQDAGTAAQSQVQQSMQARGLYNSTVMDNARMGVSSQVTRDLSDIDAAYSQMLAQLDIGEGQAIGQAQQFLSGTFGQQAGDSMQFGLSKAGLQQRYFESTYQDPNQWLNSLLGIGGNIAGIAVGSSIANSGPAGGGYGDIF